MAKIKDITAREIFDSNKTPTLEVKVFLDTGAEGTATVPSGASTGTYEAWELRDNDPSRYNGKGVLKAVANVGGPIKQKLVGMNVTDQMMIDKAMISLDGTKNKSRLGANALCGVSMACARAGSLLVKKPLYSYLADLLGLPEKELTIPFPMMVMIEGGKHGLGNNLSIQEFVVIGSLEKGKQIWKSLAAVLKNQNQETTLGLEGGFAPKIISNTQALDFLTTAIQATGLRPGVDVFIGLDLAASEFFKSGFYTIEEHQYSSDEMIDYVKNLMTKYHLYSLEDPFSQDDWYAWEQLTKILVSQNLPRQGGVKIIGDDVFATNPKRLAEGIERKVANAILIKPNQIGTLTELFETVKIAHKFRYEIVTSHRSGETEDSFIADLAVACGSILLKSGAPSKPERLAKYTRLEEIKAEVEK